MSYPDIIVSGAGTSAVNGTYIYSGTGNSKPYYLFGDYRIGWQTSLSSFWYLKASADDVAAPRYYSFDDVATPGLVTTWEQGIGDLPVPTVTADAATTYVLTGSDVTLTHTQGAQSYTLTCAAGSYTLTGSDVTLTYTQGAQNFTLTCSAGSYALTGTDVTLTKTTGAQSYTLVCSAGSYNLTGTNTGLTSARTMALESGSYALTGTNADFYRALVMACNSGSYALTGTDATFNANYIFALGVGSYVLVGTACGLFILSPTPACRTATIEFENRTFAIPHENRTLEVTCH